MSDPAPAPAPVRPTRPQRRAPIHYGEWLLRAAMLLVIVGSTALVLWSLRRLEVQRKESRELNSLVMRLSDEVEAMQRKYTQADIQRLGVRCNEARDLLFNGQEPLENWLETLQQMMVPLALDGTTQLGTTTPQNIGDAAITVIPATISLDVRPAPGIPARQTAYGRLLHFLRDVTHQSKRADLVELTVTGGPDSIARAVAVLELWAAEEGKEAESK